MNLKTNLTKKMDKAKILEDLFERDETHHSFKIGEKYEIVVRNLTYQAQHHLEKELKELKDAGVSSRQFIQSYAHSLLAKTLISWEDVKFETWDDWAEFLINKSIPILDRIVKEQEKLEEVIREACKAEEIEKVFLKGDAPDGEHDLSQKESTQEEKDQ